MQWYKIIINEFSRRQHFIIYFCINHLAKFSDCPIFLRKAIESFSISEKIFYIGTHSVSRCIIPRGRDRNIRGNIEYRTDKVKIEKENYSFIVMCLYLNKKMIDRKSWELMTSILWDDFFNSTFIYFFFYLIFTVK